MKRKKKEHPAPVASVAPGVVQLREGSSHPFGSLRQYVPLQGGDCRLYRSIREAVPVVDAAILKIIRLVGGFSPLCRDENAQEGLELFLRRVPTGHGQRGIQSFVDGYLDTMLTCGQGIGEVVLTRDGREIAGVLTGDPAEVQVVEGASALDFTLCGPDDTGAIRPYPRQQLLLFTPFNPEPAAPYGVSLLRSMPFLTEILMKIYTATGQNWERMGNLRFAVVCKPGSGELDADSAQERSELVAREWSAAMQESKNGRVRDFVAVGDVDIKVIGADNQVLDAEVPVRQILEQLIARTGIPPFMLGLSWSTTERMSAQQADMLTSELTAIRRSLEPTLERICELWLLLHGYAPQVRIQWEEINLQDQVDDAKAALYLQQARKLKLENDRLDPSRETIENLLEVRA
jgi:hypothetical protein